MRRHLKHIVIAIALLAWPSCAFAGLGSPMIEGKQITTTFLQAQGVDVASANDMTLGDDGNAFDITGVTTINTIATKGVGTRVALQFDGILQLTHSADLFMPTAANVTTAAGDIAVFYEYASADWRCESYTRADGTALIGTIPLTSVAVQTGAYAANANEFIPCNVIGGGFAVTLPTAPVNGTRIVIQSINILSSTNVLEIATGGADVLAIAGGPSSLYMSLALETVELQYDSGKAVWELNHSAPPSNFATNFPGIDAQTPLTSADITIDTGTMVLTVTPPLGYFQFSVDGGGKSTRFRKDSVVNFDAFTDTSGSWFFYFDSTGAPVTTQTPWQTSDFPNIAPVYRIYWNATEVGAAKLVDEFVEYHKNDISADNHQWMHLYGAIWATGGVMTNNALVSGAPNADGSETVIALSTMKLLDDNLEYTVTNDSTPTAAWEQDLGDTNAGTLDGTNGGEFEIFVQDGAGLVTYLAATPFPFAWGSGDDIPEYITSTGTRTNVTTTNHFVYFVYANQNPRVGEAVRIVSAPTEYATLTAARAVTWTTIQNTYSILANDGEVRPLYRLIFQARTSASPYPQAAKYTALRETQDLRKAAVTSTTAASGSLPASSVTVVPAGNIASTNAQSALEELDTEKVAKAGDSMTGTLSVPNTVYDFTTITVAGPTDNVNVALVNQIECEADDSDVTIGGTTGGVDGQELLIVVTSVAGGVCKVEHNEGTAQDWLLETGGDEVLATTGFWRCKNDGTDWHCGKTGNTMAFQTVALTGASDTITPNAGAVARIMVSTDNGAGTAVTMAETNSIVGDVRYLVNTGANKLTFTDDPGAFETTYFVLDLNNTATILYNGSAWVELSHFSNTEYLGDVNLGGIANEAKLRLNDAGVTAMPDDDSSGIYSIGRNAGEAIAQWDCVYFDDSNDEWMLADNTGEDASAPVVFKACEGLAVTSGSNGVALTVLLQGTMRNDGGTAWTSGAPLFLGTAGAMTQTRPATAAGFYQKVGVARDDDHIKFDPEDINWGIMRSTEHNDTDVLTCIEAMNTVWYHIVTGKDVTLPGLAACPLLNTTVIVEGAITIDVDVNASDRMLLDGVDLGTDGDKATSAGAAGDQITCVAKDAADIICQSNSWTDGGA